MWDEQLLIMKSAIESNRQESDGKTKNLEEDLISMITSMMEQIKISKSSPEYKYLSKDQCPTTVVQVNKRDPPFQGGNSTKIGGIWNLKHDISSPKLYELLIKTEIKGDTAMELNNFYNHTKMCLNEMTRLQEDLLPAYESIRRHY